MAHLDRLERWLKAIGTLAGYVFLLLVGALAVVLVWKIVTSDSTATGTVDERLLDMVKWTLGLVITVGGLLVGYSWFQSRSRVEDDRRTLDAHVFKLSESFNTASTESQARVSALQEEITKFAESIKQVQDRNRSQDLSILTVQNAVEPLLGEKRERDRRLSSRIARAREISYFRDDLSNNLVQSAISRVDSWAVSPGDLLAFELQDLFVDAGTFLQEYLKNDKPMIQLGTTAVEFYLDRFKDLNVFRSRAELDLVPLGYWEAALQDLIDYLSAQTSLATGMQSEDVTSPDSDEEK